MCGIRIKKVMLSIYYCSKKYVKQNSAENVDDI